MRFVSWWYVGGAVATIVVALTMSEVWSLSGIGSIGVGWGALIGTDIREKWKARREGNDSSDVEIRARWVEPLVTVVVACGLLGVGLASAVLWAALSTSRTDLSAPTVAGVVLLSVGALVVVVLIALARARADRVPSP